MKDPKRDTFSSDGEIYYDCNGMEHPAHEDGVRWPNHLHKTAPHPSSTIRTGIMREVLDEGGEPDSYDYGDHPAYPFVLTAMHKLMRVSDAYLFRQYYHRDIAIKALKEGDVQTALDHLNQIGV